MEKGDDIDKFFRGGLSGYAVEPTPKSWAEVQGQLHPKRKPLVLKSGYTWLALAVLCVLTATNPLKIEKEIPVHAWPTLITNIEASAGTATLDFQSPILNALPQREDGETEMATPMPVNQQQSDQQKFKQKEDALLERPVNHQIAQVSVQPMEDDKVVAATNLTIPAVEIADEVDIELLLSDSAMYLATQEDGSFNRVKHTSVKVVIDLRPASSDTSDSRGAAPQKEKLKLGKFLRRLQDLNRDN